MDELNLIQSLIYEKLNLKLSSFLIEEESSDYGACEFKLKKLTVKFRVAKITPTKIGQFVTFWKRKKNGPIEPFSSSDPIDLFIVSTRMGVHNGHFVFPKSVLCEQGVLTYKGKEGKRAIRVYPPWDKALNKQAQKTQKWQLEFFIDMSNEKRIDINRAGMLYKKS